MVAGWRPPSPDGAGAAGAAAAGFEALPFEAVDSGLICIASFGRLLRSDDFLCDVFLSDILPDDALSRDTLRFIKQS
jgi:hypothetical protein